MNSYLTLIAKKLSGEIEPEEDKNLQSWIDASTENKNLFHKLKDIWQNGKLEPRISGQEQTFAKIADQLGLASHENVSHNNQPASFRRYWFSAAAVLLLCLGTALFFFWQATTDLPEAETLVENNSVERITKSNSRGQKSIIHLPDGSEVRLNAESYLEYTKDFKTSREIKLVGEAFFDVARDTTHPFTVTTGDIKVKVLGTSFNVRAFPYDEEMSVAVASGVVEVEKKENRKQRRLSQLHPLEMVVVNHKRGDFEVSSFDPDKILAWKEGVLVFQKESFEEIIHKLERWYGVDFIIKRSMPVTDGFTGRYNNPSLKVVLEGMSYSSDFTYTIEGDTVIIQ
ncbi:transmembrane sensor [Catalinimonas alkaloidigena]|uniref:FecR family protein n=1 Tax=Catalinimonas alkaloidigena TaxID=1075417 RepID=UPI002405D8E7|nr:FecR family protein [Catalinimonas alkaloidigena]MDF9796946.1 transmembrane sensor [Catalinimonas alkaloidigena]